MKSSPRKSQKENRPWPALASNRGTNAQGGLKSMQSYRRSIAILIAVVATASCVVLIAAQTSPQVVAEPVRESGQSVTGAFEGWYRNPDGTFSLLLGYFNRNSKQILDIPVGPNNRIEPAGPDQGQPTHFLPRRQWGAFRIVVP